MLPVPLAFLRGWTRDPVAIGLPFASSVWTARRLAKAALKAAIPRSGPVLELGAGTGSVTQALLEAGCPLDRLVVIERDAQLCSTLKRRFRGLCVLQGDALDLGGILTEASIALVSVVVSGLPMRAVSPLAAVRCYLGAFRSMPSGGAIIQYTYGFKAPVDPDDEALKLDATFIGREWRNVPPIAIWKYRLVAAYGAFPSRQRRTRTGTDTQDPFHLIKSRLLGPLTRYVVTV